MWICVFLWLFLFCENLNKWETRKFVTDQRRWIVIIAKRRYRATNQQNANKKVARRNTIKLVLNRIILIRNSFVHCIYVSNVAQQQWTTVLFVKSLFVKVTCFNFKKFLFNFFHAKIFFILQFIFRKIWSSQKEHLFVKIIKMASNWWLRQSKTGKKQCTSWN